MCISIFRRVHLCLHKRPAMSTEAQKPAAAAGEDNAAGGTAGNETMSQPEELEGSKWMLVKDDKSNQSFYYNIETRDTSWVRPDRPKNDEHSAATAEQLVEAAEAGDTDALQDLIEAGADLDAAHNGYTPLLMASFCGQLYVVEMLIEAGVDINAVSQDEQECTALHNAAQSRDVELAQLLIRHKAKINAQSKKGTTPLLLAAQEGAFDLVKNLIDLKADCEICDEHGVTPFYYAASENNLPMAELLLEVRSSAVLCAEAC